MATWSLISGGRKHHSKVSMTGEDSRDTSILNCLRFNLFREKCQNCPNFLSLKVKSRKQFQTVFLRPKILNISLARLQTQLTHPATFRFSRNFYRACFQKKTVKNPAAYYWTRLGLLQGAAIKRPHYRKEISLKRVVGWVGLWVQSFHFAMGWVGLKKLYPRTILW